MPVNTEPTPLATIGDFAVYHLPDVLGREQKSGTFLSGAHFPVPCGGRVTRTPTSFVFTVLELP